MPALFVAVLSGWMGWIKNTLLGFGADRCGEGGIWKGCMWLREMMYWICRGWTSNLLPTVVPKASLDLMVRGRLGALPLPSVCSAWSYKLQVLAALGQYCIVHCRGRRLLTLPALTRRMGLGTEGMDVGVWPEHGRGAEPGRCRTFLYQKSGDEPSYPGRVTHPKALLAGLPIS